MIEFKNVGIKVNKKELFHNLNLEIKPGKITGIIAPSGTGKTTLFNAMMGLQNIDKGQIYFAGEELKKQKMYQDIAYMPQEGGVYGDLTGKENVKFFAKLAKVKLKNQEIKQLFNEFSLEDAIDKKVNQYSGGMKKKLGLMISLIGESKYFFLDEPTVGIDPVQKEEFWQKLMKLRNTGKTIIVTTHVMDEASRCDCLIFIRNGQIIANDNQDNILKQVGAKDLNEAFIKLAKGNL